MLEVSGKGPQVNPYYAEILEGMGLKIGYGRNDVMISGGSPFEFVRELLAPGIHTELDKKVDTLTFPDYRKAKRFFDLAKAKGLFVYPHRNIKKRGIDYVRTKHYRNVLVRST